MYYITSAGAGLWNKYLVDDNKAHVAPTTLTLLHLLIGLGSDTTIRHLTQDNRAAAILAADYHRTWYDTFTAFLPIAVFITLSKLTTYLSYQYVSMALAHTAKASEPIFNVIVCAIAFKEYHSSQVYLTLLPISIGIALASISDFTYNHTGFFIAIVSALMKVLQNIYTKRLFDTGKWTFWEIHLYCGAASLLLMAPVLYVESVTFSGSPFSHLPIFALFFDSILQWLSSVSAYVVLSLVSSLTATIVNVMKRLVMIVSGDLFDGISMSPFNGLGVFLAMLGVLSYNLVKDQNTGHQSPEEDEAPWHALARGVVWLGKQTSIACRHINTHLITSGWLQYLPLPIQQYIFNIQITVSNFFQKDRRSNSTVSDNHTDMVSSSVSSSNTANISTNLNENTDNNNTTNTNRDIEIGGFSNLSNDTRNRRI